MSTVRITLSVPEELAGRIKTAAGESTVSGWVVQIIEQHLAQDTELERQFEEWLAEHPIDADAQRWVDDVMSKVTRNRHRDGAA